jgi:hypothetical protein
MPTQEELATIQELYDGPTPAQGKLRKNKNTEQRKQELETSPAVIAYGPNWTQCRGCHTSIVGERRKRMTVSTASQSADNHDYYLTNWHKHWSKCKYLHIMGVSQLFFLSCLCARDDLFCSSAHLYSLEGQSITPEASVGQHTGTLGNKNSGTRACNTS